MSNTPYPNRSESGSREAAVTTATSRGPESFRGIWAFVAIAILVTIAATSYGALITVALLLPLPGVYICVHRGLRAAALLAMPVTVAAIIVATGAASGVDVFVIVAAVVWLTCGGAAVHTWALQRPLATAKHGPSIEPAPARDFDAPRSGPDDSARRPVPQANDRGSEIVAIGLFWLAIVLLALTTVGVIDGVDGAQARLAATVDDSYAQLLESLPESGDVAARYRESVEIQREAVGKALLDYGLALISGFLAVVAVASAVTTHGMARYFFGRKSAGRHASFTLSQFDMHWSIAYVLAGGLLWIGIAIQVASINSLAAVPGILLTTLAGLFVLTQGAAYAWWRLTRPGVSGWTRWILVIVAFFLSSLTMLVLTMLAVYDLSRRPRQQKSGRLDRRSTDDS